MAHTQALDIQGEGQTLKDVLASYHFEFDTGVVVGEPSTTSSDISFFMRNENGQENDLTLNTQIQAREGHKVSVLYASKNKDDFMTAIAWVNHTTGKVDYLKENIYRVTGDKLTMFFLKVSLATVHAMSVLSNGHGMIVNLLILPVTLSFLAISLGFLALGSLFGVGSARTAKKIREHAQDMIVGLDSKYAVYNKKKSLILSILKWKAILLAGFVFVVYVLDEILHVI